MELKIADKAPAFEALDQDGNKVSSGDYKGKKIILYFYPKDNTTGCTAEACSLRDGYPQLIGQGFVVLGVSTDSSTSHRKFMDKHSLPFTLLVDSDHKIAEAYGTWGEKKMMGRTYMGMIRTTFVIDGDGKIEKIFTKVDTKDHFNQILDSYK